MLLDRRGTWARTGWPPGGNGRLKAATLGAARMQSAFRDDLFDGHRLFITGGATGIGLAISEGFARLGADVIISSRKEENLKAACDRLEGLGKGTPSYHVGDVRDIDRMNEIGKALFKDGGVDTLINCAAGNFVTPFSAMSDNAWNSVIDIVLNGTYNVTRAVGSRMLEQGREGANIQNIIAGYAWTGAPMVSHSGAAKAGVLNLTRSLAVEWAPKIRCNAISPGPIGGTEGMKRLAEDFGLGDAAAKAVPLQRLGDPEDIANACIFLASPAAKYVTGVALSVDGGQDVRGPFWDLFSALHSE